MEVNQLPIMNMDNSETKCCPKFNPEAWENQTIVFDNKLFVKTQTKSFLHIPLGLGKMWMRTLNAIKGVDAELKDNYFTLSYDPSPWKGEHYFAVTKDVPGEEMVKLSGEYLTKVFEGPFSQVGKWAKEMETYVESKDKEVKKVYFFYTSCPKCAKHYGKNYVVALAQV
jgi:hypothetical protein